MRCTLGTGCRDIGRLACAEGSDDQRAEAAISGQRGGPDPQPIVAYGYHDPAHVHAVTHLTMLLTEEQKYRYDANGNQTRRVVGADTYDLAYDAENRLVEVQKNGAVEGTSPC